MHTGPKAMIPMVWIGKGVPDYRFKIVRDSQGTERLERSDRPTPQEIFDAHQHGRTGT